MTDFRTVQLEKFSIATYGTYNHHTLADLTHFSTWVESSVHYILYCSKKCGICKDYLHCLCLFFKIDLLRHGLSQTDPYQLDAIPPCGGHFAITGVIIRTNSFRTAAAIVAPSHKSANVGRVALTRYQVAIETHIDVKMYFFFCLFVC